MHAHSHTHTHTHTHTQWYWQEPLLIHLPEENEVRTHTHTYLHNIPLITEFTKLYSQSLCDMTTPFFTFKRGEEFCYHSTEKNHKIVNDYLLVLLVHVIGIKLCNITFRFQTLEAYWVNYELVNHWAHLSLSLSEFTKLLQPLRPPFSLSLSLPDDRKNTPLIPFRLLDMNKIYVQCVVLSLAQSR